MGILLIAMVPLAQADSWSFDDSSCRPGYYGGWGNDSSCSSSDFGMGIHLDIGYPQPGWGQAALWNMGTPVGLYNGYNYCNGYPGCYPQLRTTLGSARSHTLGELF